MDFHSKFDLYEISQKDEFWDIYCNKVIIENNIWEENKINTIKELYKDKFDSLVSEDSSELWVNIKHWLYQSQLDERDNIQDDLHSSITWMELKWSTVKICRNNSDEINKNLIDGLIYILKNKDWFPNNKDVNNLKMIEEWVNDVNIFKELWINNIWKKKNTWLWKF